MASFWSDELGLDSVGDHVYPPWENVGREGSDMTHVLEFSFPIEERSFARAGDASARVKDLLKQASIPTPLVRRAVVVAYEAELNMIIHSKGGTLELLVSESEILLRAVDVGPGITDIEKAMLEGYSTAPPEARKLGFGGGMGLPNMRRHADELQIISDPEHGTIMTARIYLKPEDQRQLS